VTTAIHCLVRGQVQGVGYRAWCQGEAVTRGLSGLVRNRRSGDVEAVLAGPLDVVDEMLAALWTGPAGASVSAVEGTPTEERPRGDFDVRPTV